MKIKIGTRKSRLALAQAQMVAREILEKFPDTQLEFVHISTQGDITPDRQLSSFGGKGIFVSEIEKALQSGSIDIAVHSAKDLPLALGDGLEICAVLKRGNYRDVLVTRKGCPPENSPDFIIGTGSPRRRINLKKIYSSVSFKEIRGNVDTRLNKLASSEYGGIILAYAGLERLALLNDGRFDFAAFDYTEFMPAPCQGIIAVECRKNGFAAQILSQINDPETFLSFETERYFLKKLNAVCGMPLGAYSFCENGKITVALSKDSRTAFGSAKAENSFKLVEEMILRL